MRSFVDQLSESYHQQERTSTMVPEFKDDSGKPLRVYAIKPTLHHLSIVEKYANQTKGGQAATLARLATIVLQDEAGTSLVPFKDIKKLQSGVDSDVLSRIFQELGIAADDLESQIENGDMESARKNSPPPAPGG